MTERLVDLTGDVLDGAVADGGVAVAVAEAFDDDHVEVGEPTDEGRKVDRGCCGAVPAEHDHSRPGSAVAVHVEFARGDPHFLAVGRDARFLGRRDQGVRRGGHEQEGRDGARCDGGVAERSPPAGLPPR